MTSVKKIKVALLALVAALVIAIPTSAFAKDITLNADTSGDTYTAYQVFSGNISDGMLVNIDWGNGVDGDALLADLRNETAFAACQSATDVAKVLGQETSFDNAAAQAFAKVAAKHVATGTNFDEDPEYTYKAEGLAEGYYLILQSENGQTANGTEGAITRYILSYNQNEVNAKASVPSVEKGVMEDDDEDAEEGNIDTYVDGADYYIGQKIPYYVAGTLPTRYDEYTEYFYQFTDTMSSGLTYVDGSAKLYVYNYDSAIDAWVQGNSLTADSIDWTDNDNVLTVTINDLKKQVGEYSADVKIVVLYEAELNEGCIIGNPGNPNKVKLTFSNDANYTGKGEEGPTGDTPEDYAVVFTFELKDTKIDEATRGSETETVLANAKFVLSNEDGLYYGGVEEDADGVKAIKWVAKESAVELESDENGLFGVKGLDTGSYTLEETVAPEGYSLGGPWTFKITATIPQNPTYPGGAQVLDLAIDTTPSADQATVGQKIGNDKGTGLPSTGGIGTTIFTIVGIALIVAAAAIMVVRRRNASAVQ